MRLLTASARLLAAAALLLLAGPAGARASWSPPFDLSAPAAGANARVAAGGTGGAVVVWEGDGGATVVARARRIASGGALGPVLDVSDPAVFGTQPDVALDAQGNAVVAWEEPGVGGTAAVRARRISAAGALGPAIDVSPAGDDGRAPRVAVDPAGNATVVWLRSNGGFSYTIRARRIDAGGGLSAAVDLSDDEASPNGYHVAADPLGNAYAVWVRQAVAQGRRIAAGGVLGPVENLSGTGDQADRPVVAVDATGKPTVAWQLSGGTVQLRRGDLGATIDLAGPDAVLPQLAIDPAGTATVAWLRWDGTAHRTELRRVDAAGTAGATTELWTGGSDERPQVAVDRHGNATVVWLNLDDSGNPAIRTRGVSAAGTVGPPRDVSTPGEQELLDPAVASDPAGNVVAAWTRYQDPDYRIVGARLPAPPEATPTSPTPPAGPAAPLACPPVTIEKLATLRPGRRPPRRTRAKGVAARLRFSAAAQVKLLSATLSYRLESRRRTATLKSRRLTGTRASRAVRFRLPERLAATLRRGQRVTLTLRLRARARRAGCPLGRTKTLRLRTRVIWISARANTGRR